MSRERKNPKTSLDAYKSLSVEQINSHFAKIIEGLKVLGTATAEKLADHLTMQHVQVTRRLSEMERLEIIYKPGTKSKTKTGRDAFNWCLRKAGQIIEHPKTEKVMEGKTVQDFSRDLMPIQQNLF